MDGPPMFRSRRWEMEYGDERKFAVVLGVLVLTLLSRRVHFSVVEPTFAQPRNPRYSLELSYVTAPNISGSSHCHIIRRKVFTLPPDADRSTIIFQRWPTV